MPEQVERCVQSLLKKWEDDPSSRPTPKEDQDAKAQAYAICTAAYNKGQEEALSIQFAQDGLGPTLLGIAATNRPYIPQLQPIRLHDGPDGKKYATMHIANPGYFQHPRGHFVLNRQVFSNMIANFTSNVVGQDVALDAHHEPEKGALGWVRGLSVDEKNRFFAEAEVTPLGENLLGGSVYRYCSMEFHRNFNRDDVALDLADATQDFCLAIELEPIENVGGKKMDDKERLELEQKAKEAEDRAKAAADRIAQLERDAREAADRVIQLQKNELERRIANVLKLAKSMSDQDGNSASKVLLDWVEAVMRFASIGDGADTVRLESDSDVPFAVRQYVVGAAEYLLSRVPGLVPTQRKTNPGGDGNEDTFEYKNVWD